MCSSQKFFLFRPVEALSAVKEKDGSLKKLARRFAQFQNGPTQLKRVSFLSEFDEKV